MTWVTLGDARGGGTLCGGRERCHGVVSRMDADVAGHRRTPTDSWAILGPSMPHESFRPFGPAPHRRITRPIETPTCDVMHCVNRIVLLDVYMYLMIRVMRIYACTMLSGILLCVHSECANQN